ncbi:MAG: hypothetical protein ACT4QG_19080 [Sporichthyaceae bacterium]
MRSPLEDLVARAVDDWVSAAEVYEIAQRNGASTPSAARTRAIALVADALRDGLMVAGFIEATGHWPWDCSPTVAIERVTAEWLALASPRPRPGEICWLDNTPAGRALGEAVLAREAATRH